MGGLTLTNVFTTHDAVFIVFSVITYLAALCTDIVVGIHLLSLGFINWGIVVIAIAVVVSAIMAIVSLCWYFKEPTEGGRGMKSIIHLLLLAQIYRYVDVMTHGIDAQRSPSKTSCEAYFQSVRDACLVRLIEAFLQSAPQFMIQLYLIVAMDLHHEVLWLSVSMSAISIASSMAAHITAKHLRFNHNHELRWPSATVLFVWHFAMVTSRVLAIIVFTQTFTHWILLALGIHWCVMSIWMCAQNDHSNRHPCTACVLDVIYGYIHIFCFFNTRPGHTRLRVFIYYLTILIQDALFVGLWTGLKPNGSSPTVIIVSSVFGGFLFAVLLMFLYYGCCHDGGRFVHITGPFFVRNNCLSSQENTYTRNPSPCDMSDEHFTKQELKNKQKHPKNMNKKETRETASSTASNEYLIKNQNHQIHPNNDHRNYKHRPEHNEQRRHGDKLYTITTSVSTYNDGRYSPSASSGKVSISPLDASRLWEVSTEKCRAVDDRRYYDSTSDEMVRRKNWEGDGVDLRPGEVRNARPDRNKRSSSPADDRQVGRSGRSTSGTAATRRGDGHFVDRMEYKKQPSNMDDASMLYSKLDTGRYTSDDPDLDFDGRVGVRDSVVSKRDDTRCDDSITTPMKHAGFVAPAQGNVDPTNDMYRRILKGMARPRDSIEEYSASPYKSSSHADDSSNRLLASLAQTYGGESGGVSKTTSKEQLDEIARRMSSGDDSDYSDEIVSYLDSDGPHDAPGGSGQERDTEDKRYYDNTRDHVKRKDDWNDTTHVAHGSAVRSGMNEEKRGKPWEDITSEICNNSPHLEHVESIRNNYVPGNDILSSLVTSGPKAQPGSGKVQRTQSGSEPGNEVMKTLITGAEDSDQKRSGKAHPLAESSSKDSRFAGRQASRPPTAPKNRTRDRRQRQGSDSGVVDRADSLRHADQVKQVYVPGNEILQTFVAEDGTPGNDASQVGSNVGRGKRGNSLMQELVSSGTGVRETAIDGMGGGKENVSGEGKKGGKDEQGRRKQRRPLGSVNTPSMRL